MCIKVVLMLTLTIASFPLTKKLIHSFNLPQPQHSKKRSLPQPKQPKKKSFPHQQKAPKFHPLRPLLTPHSLHPVWTPHSCVLTTRWATLSLLESSSHHGGTPIFFIFILPHCHHPFHSTMPKQPWTKGNQAPLLPMNLNVCESDWYVQGPGCSNNKKCSPLGPMKFR